MNRDSKKNSIEKPTWSKKKLTSTIRLIVIRNIWSFVFSNWFERRDSFQNVCRNWKSKKCWFRKKKNCLRKCCIVEKKLCFEIFLNSNKLYSRFLNLSKFERFRIIFNKFSNFRSRDLFMKWLSIWSKNDWKLTFWSFFMNRIEIFDF